jgi:hypothetical protein
MHVIGSLYGGVAMYNVLPHRSNRQAEAEERRQKERDSIDAFLGPQELRGPPTDEEWTELRVARAQRSTDGEPAQDPVFGALPEGPWYAEDREVLDAAVRALREGDSSLAMPIALTLSAKPDESYLPLFDTLLELCEPRSRPLIKTCRRDTREALGFLPVPQRDGEPPHASEAEESEWMDEPEDDD